MMPKLVEMSQARRRSSRRCAARSTPRVAFRVVQRVALTRCVRNCPAQEYKDVKFVKCNCNKEFKDIGKALGIRVAPTFHLYKQGKQLAVMTGAKVDELRELILAHK